MRSALICAAQAPFITGGAEILVRELREHLAARGFQVDVASVPFKWYPVSELLRQALAWRLLDVTESNGTPVDLDQLAVFEGQNGDNYCKLYYTVVFRWPHGETTLVNNVSFTRAINDGQSDYPAGKHEYEYKVTLP